MADTDNARIWAGADVMVADVGSTAPTDTTSAFDAAFESLGLIGEDGITLSGESEKSDHYAYGGLHVRTTQSKFKKSLKVVCLEDTPAVFDLVNPGSSAATATGTTTRTVGAPAANPKAFAIETVDGDITRRLIIPRGEVSEVGEVTFSDAEMTGVELTIEAYAAEDGTFYIEITDDPQAAVA